MPWPENNTLLELQFLTKTYDSRLLFRNGKKAGSLWGIQNWATYTKQSTDAEAQFKSSKKIKFWLPTVQYFSIMPEAPIALYAGNKALNGKQYDLVLCSWNTHEPQRKIDQYLLWINQENHL